MLVTKCKTNTSPLKFRGLFYSFITQLVEYETFNFGVAGSNPAGGTGMAGIYDIMMEDDWRSTPLTDWEKENLLPLTPQTLVKYGFKYKASRAGGQDQWAGMPVWEGKFLTLRGRCSTSGNTDLRVEGYFNSNINRLTDLKQVHYLLCGVELKPVP